MSSISYKIPPKARPITAAAQFVAVFNNPTAGKYDFGINLNKHKKLIDLNFNTSYLVDRIQIGGTIDQGDYSESLQEKPLEISLQREKSKTFNVYERPYQIINYTDSAEFETWIHSDKGGSEKDQLLVSCNNVLNQISNTVGVIEIRINVMFTIYAIDSDSWFQWYRGTIEKSSGQSLVD